MKKNTPGMAGSGGQKRAMPGFGGLTCCIVISYANRARFSGEKGPKKGKTMPDTQIERELLKIYAIADILITIDPCELEKNTMPALAVIIQETVQKIKSILRQGAQGG